MQSIHFVKWKIGIDNCRGFFPPAKGCKTTLDDYILSNPFFFFLFFFLSSRSIFSQRVIKRYSRFLHDRVFTCDRDISRNVQIIERIR